MAKARVDMEDLVLAYLAWLLGEDRTQEVIGDLLGYKRAGAGHILNKKRRLRVEHLQRICDRWEILPSDMLRTLTVGAQNVRTTLIPRFRLMTGQ